jgi:phosphatidylserine/phosphatidylglycerophosphate/cardiolipin synthase-like enzyme
MKSRNFINTRSKHRNEIKDLLQSLMVGEFLAPSKEFWLVSPWISNLQVLDNRAGTFRGLYSGTNYRSASLVDVLEYLANTGAEVTVVTRPVDSADIVQELERRSASVRVPGFLRVIERETLHTKGLLGDTFCVSGSMNFTYSGVNLNDEFVTLHTDEQEVSRIRLEFSDEYGQDHD